MADYDNCEDADAAYANNINEFNEMARRHLAMREVNRLIVLQILQRPDPGQHNRITGSKRKDRWPGLCSERQPRLCMLRGPTQPGGTISNPPPPLTPERSDEEDQRINESSVL